MPLEKWLIGLLWCAQSIFAFIQISENTVNRFSFSWEMQGLSIIDSTDKPAHVSFSDYNVDLGDSGQAALPAKAFLIGIPPHGNAAAHFTAISTKTIKLKNALRLRKADPRVIRYPNLRFSNPWISDARPCMLGQIHADQFIIKPFIYDEKNRTLQVLLKAQCTIEFPAFLQMGVKVSAENDYQKMVSRLLLNYSVASAWARPAQALSKRKAAEISEDFPLAPTKPMITFTIGDGHDGINEGTISENGIIKIPGKDMLRLFGVPLPFSRLACYGSHKGELPVPTPGIADLPDGIGEIPLMRFDLNNNGTVDSEDYVLLYVTGASDWGFDTASHQYYYNLDRYEDYRHYWLFEKQSGASPLEFQRMPVVNGPVSTTLTSFQNHVLFKKPVDLSSYGGGDGGLDWFWQRISILSPQFEYQVLLPQVDTTKPASLKISADRSVGPVTFSGAGVGGSCDSSTWYIFDYTGDKTLKIRRDIYTDTVSIELRQLEFKYSTRLDMLNTSAMVVFSPESAGVIRYVLGALPKQLVYIFRITPSESIQLVDTIHGETVSSYLWTDSAGKGIKYYICTESAFQQTPSLSTQAALQSSGVYIHDLRALNSPASNRADYMVIYHPDFITQAKRLADHKQNIGRFKSPKVIDIKDIYREFSGGATDPAALRNFLVYARSQWGLFPDYVVLMGKGNYNYKGIKLSEPEYIPVAEGGGKCVEDFFAVLDSGTDPYSDFVSPGIFIGRLPCTTIPQATQMVDKILDFEDPKTADFGAWRNRGVLVNDDDTQGVKEDASHFDHVNSSEKLSALISQKRPDIDARKVNLFEYPFNELRFKPEAKAALINEINNGASFVNYFGHGSISLWADEQILNSDALSGLHNYKQYPLISSFSCSVGRFDSPGQRSLSEDIVLAAQSGAIAAISATREAWASENQTLAINFYSAMFDSAHAGISFGEGYSSAKIQTGDENSKIYALFGDPSLRPANCVYDIALSIIDKSGKSLDTLKALQDITVRGSIKAKGGSQTSGGYGSASKPASVQICIFNPPYTTTRKDKGLNNTIDYSMPGSLLFGNQADVKNGMFEQTLHLPRKVTFNKPGAKLTAFSWQGFDNGVGSKNIFFNGSIPPDSGSVDSVGPTITIRQLFDQTGSVDVNKSTVNALSTSRIQAALPFSCEIDVFDPSGIDNAGTGPDEGLTVEIAGVLSKQNINQKFRFVDGDYRKGAAAIEFTEGNIRSGTYTMTVSAQDLAGNVTRKDFTLEVSQNQDLSISQVFNYPNPMKMGSTTAFYFNLSKSSGIMCTIKLYTLSGKLIRVFYGAHSGEVFDGRDQIGNLLGPKVYLYQVIAEDNSQSQQKIVKSGIQKLAVHPPR